MRNTVIALSLAAGLFVGGCTSSKPSASAPAPTTYTPDWTSLAQYNEQPEWFKDAKFGVYFHWGILSVPAFANDWYPRNMHVVGTPEYQHHLETYGHPSKFGYHDFVPMFKAEKFDAEEWAELFQKAGARFAGPMAEHHEGFSMWASKVTPWNVKDMGPKRDVMAELEKAIHGRGMKLMTTFHMARNLQLYADNPEAKTDKSYFPYEADMSTSSTDPKLRMLYGNLPAEEFYQNWKAKLSEVIDNYSPDIIYFDGMEGKIPEKYKQEFVAHYFNKANEQGKQVVITHKSDDFPDEVSIKDFEKGRMNEITPDTWLTDETISTGSWSYTNDLQLKPTADIIHVLADIVSKNGVMVLNISPKADGEIPQDQQQVLLQIGDWLNEHGEAIYATRLWVVYGEGPTKLEKAGHFLPVVKYTPQDVRYTTKGNTIYAIVLGWPGGNQQVLLESFAKDKLKGNLKIKRVSMLGSRDKIKHNWQDNGLTLTTPSEKVNDMAVVFKIETKGKAEL
ncbi:alpha-L-fucosidase [Pontibacter pamirensis]|uniref:alpha-L-fucosidase n=1 Tax=Pontibacter pamirensis TaxID=2562824 RepID=UPI001389F544|nr:alpha-L-fucosidase [Pontibacter pamirensis]